MDTTDKNQILGVLLAGYRYSGRSLVLQRLELAGYTCVDNLPPALVRDYLARDRGNGSPRRMAISLDTDFSGGPTEVMTLLDRLAEEGSPCKLVFLEAGDGALRERQAAAEDTDLGWNEEELEAMRVSMAGIRARADLVLDSSYASPLEERDRIIALVEGRLHRAGTKVDVLTFGFKYGAPQGDLVLDVRFIPNPYYVAALRPLTGMDPACAEYVLGHEGARATVQALVSLVQAMLPSYTAQGRNTLRIRIGCTGGRHRSVAVADALSKALGDLGLPVSLRHRELDGGTS